MMTASPFFEKEKILENGVGFVVYDGFPVSEGHCLIVPHRVYSDYFDIKNQIPLFNLDRGKEPPRSDLFVGQHNKISRSDCEKIYKEDLLEIRRDIELLEIRKQIFEDISDHIEDYTETY